MTPTELKALGYSILYHYYDGWSWGVYLNGELVALYTIDEEKDDEVECWKLAEEHWKRNL